MRRRLAEYIDERVVRVPWPDDQALPGPGRRLRIDLIERGRTVAADVRVVVALADWEPGWIQVEIERAA